MFMAVENMAHGNMSVKYIIGAKGKEKEKPTYDKIQEQEYKKPVKYVAFLQLVWSRETQMQRL